MIAGMMPMALALGEGAEATAPLGRAVIGGLAAATVATLLVLPSVYSLVQQSAWVRWRSNHLKLALEGSLINVKTALSGFAYHPIERHLR